MRAFFIRACLAGVFALLLWSAATPGAVAAPRLWVETSIDRSEVPVNVQATFLVRFGHAVDVRSPRLDPPEARLAEIVALGPITQSETLRDGLRYRVLERRFAVLPFASGDLLLSAHVAGETSAALPEIGGRAQFSLAAPPVRLGVHPAPVQAEWMPAQRLQFSADNATAPAMRVGDVWTRELLIEAEGIDGSVISPPHWPVTAAWSLQFDPPVVGRRVEAGQVVGYRRQTVHAQALQAGRLVFPVPRLAWWHVPSGQWRESSLLESSVEVRAAAGSFVSAAPAPTSNAQKNASTNSGRKARNGVAWPTTLWWGMPLAMLAGLVVLLGPWPAGRRALGSAWRRRCLRRALLAACRANDASATRRAVLAWAAACGMPARSLGALAERDEVGCDAFASSIAGLEVACYGRHGEAWDGRTLHRALRRWRRGPFVGGLSDPRGRW